MFDETPTKEHVLVNAVLVELYDRRPFKHDLPRMEDEQPALFQEMLAEMLDSVQRVLMYGSYQDHAVPKDLPTAQERIEELEAKVAKLESLCGVGLEELFLNAMDPEPPPDWVVKLAEEQRKKKTSGK